MDEHVLKADTLVISMVESTRIYRRVNENPLYIQAGEYFRTKKTRI